MKEEKKFHILKLEASNIKGIKAVLIEPSAGVISIEGKNGNGKTSALDAIEMALRGQKFIPNEPIRKGETKGEIILELGDHVSKDVDLIVKRTFTEKGSYLKVTNGEGLEYKSAQGMLDALCGAMAFDPMEFTRMDAKKRIETLKKLGGLNFDEIDKAFNSIFSNRTDVNKEVKMIESQLEEYLECQKVEVPDISKVQQERQLAQDHNILVTTKKTDLKRHQESIQNEERQIEVLLSDIEKLKSNILKRQERIEEINKSDMDFKDLDLFDEQIRSVSKLERENERYAQKERLTEKLNSSKELASSMTEKLEALRSEKANMLHNAKLPVEGLDFNDGDVTYQGIEFGQINMAKKIEISMAMAISLNPRLKVVRIMNGSLIDSEGMERISEIAKEKGFDVWIERVSEEKTTDNSFLITEGVLGE